MGSEITHLADEATQKTNATGQDTLILEYTPEDGTMLQVRNRVAKGSAMGVPIYMKLRDGSNNPLPNDTIVILRVDVPSKKDPIVISEEIENISSWNSLTLSEQRNEENVDAVKVLLEDKVANVRYIDTLGVYVEASAQVDWSNSELYVDKNATRRVSFE